MIEPLINLAPVLGTARDQKSRGMCLGFAASDCNRYWNAANDPLSVDYLAHHAVQHILNWKAGDGLSIDAVTRALAQPGQPAESDYPYDPADHGRPLLPIPASVSTLSRAVATKRKLSATQVADEIRAGQPVCLITAVSDTFLTPKNGIVEYSAKYRPNVLHAVIGVGLGEHLKTGEAYVFVRNSWGTKWGINGHAWMPLQYLNTHLFDSFSC
jgi:C1A family cysteine protease